MGYADLDAAAHDLGLRMDEADDGGYIARLAELDDTVSTMLDEKIGRSFGGVAAPATRSIPLPPRSGFAVLSLPFPVRSVTAISIAGDGAINLGLTDWVLANPVERTGDYHAIQRIDGGTWPSRESGRSAVSVTGIWSDANTGEAVPADIVDVTTFLLVEEFRLRRVSPTGEIGVSDGMVVPTRNPWNFEIVKTAVRKYGPAKSRASY